MNIFRVKIRQGRLAVVADNIFHAERQADQLERDLNYYWVRNLTHAGGDLFILGAIAWAEYRRQQHHIKVLKEWNEQHKRSAATYGGMGEPHEVRS